MADIWINILGDATKLKGALGKAESQVSKFSEKVKKIGKIATVAGTAVTGAFAAIITKTAQAGDQFDKMSLRTGVAVEDLSSLAYAANISGTDITTLENSLRFLVRGMDDAAKGTGEAKDAFEKLNISVVDTEGNLRPTIDVMKEAATKIANMTNETDKIAVATDIFGSRYGTQLLPLLKAGGVGIEDLMNKAKELGITMSTEAATKAAEFTDRMTDLKGSLAGAGRMIGDTLIPAITPLIEKVVEAIGNVKTWAEDNKSLVEGIFKLAAGLGAALMVLGPIAVILPSLITGFSLLAPAMLPFAAGAAIVIGFKKLSEYLKDVREETYALNIGLAGMKLEEIDKEVEGLAVRANELQLAMSEMDWGTEDAYTATIQYRSYQIELAEINDKLGILYEKREELTKAEQEGIDVAKQKAKLGEEEKKLLDDLAQKETEQKEALEAKTKAAELANAQTEIGNDIYKLTHTKMDIAIRDLESQKKAYIDLGIEVKIVNRWFELEMDRLYDLNKSVFKCGQQFKKFGEDVEVAGDKLPTKEVFLCGQQFLKLGEDVVVMGDKLPELETAFISLEDTVKPIITSITGYLETQLAGAISGLLSQSEDFEWSWSKFWEGLKNTLINAVAAMIAKLVVLAAFRWLFPWLPFDTGGGVGYNLGGEVKKYQAGGMADTIPARLTIGEYVISKPMTDFIRKFKAIPQNLVEAVVRGLPTPTPAFAGGGPVGTSNITSTSFGETKIYVDIHDNRISDDVDIRRLASTVSGEILRKINLNRRH